MWCLKFHYLPKRFIDARRSDITNRLGCRSAVLPWPIILCFFRLFFSPMKLLIDILYINLTISYKYSHVFKIFSAFKLPEWCVNSYQYKSKCKRAVELNNWFSFYLLFELFLQKNWKYSLASDCNLTVFSVCFVHVSMVHRLCFIVLERSGNTVEKFPWVLAKQHHDLWSG